MEDFFLDHPILFILATTALLIGAVVIVVYFVNEYGWSEPFEQEATLLTQKYNESTEETQVVPVFTGGKNGGMGMGVTSSGNPESYITIWDCGKYGRLKVDDEEVFRWARPKAKLLLRTRGTAARIEGIVPPHEAR